MLILQIHKVCYNSKLKQKWLVMLVGYECIALKLACNVCIRSITSYRFVCLRQRQKERNTHRSGPSFQHPPDLHGSDTLGSALPPI